MKIVDIKSSRSTRTGYNAVDSMDTGERSFDVFNKSDGMTNNKSIIRNDNDGFVLGAGGIIIQDNKDEEPTIYSQSVWFPSFSSHGGFQGDDPFTKSCVESTESPTKVTEFDERNSPWFAVSSHLPDNSIDSNPFQDPSVVSSHISDPPVISSYISDNNMDFNPFLDPYKFEHQRGLDNDLSSQNDELKGKILFPESKKDTSSKRHSNTGNINPVEEANFHDPFVVSSHIPDNNIDFNPFHDPWTDAENDKFEHQRGLDNGLPSLNDKLKGKILLPESRKDTSGKRCSNTRNINPVEETEAWWDPLDKDFFEKEVKNDIIEPDQKYVTRDDIEERNKQHNHHHHLLQKISNDCTKKEVKPAVQDFSSYTPIRGPHKLVQTSVNNPTRSDCCNDNTQTKETTNQKYENNRKEKIFHWERYIGDFQIGTNITNTIFEARRRIMECQELSNRHEPSDVGVSSFCTSPSNEFSKSIINDRMFSYTSCQAFSTSTGHGAMIIPFDDSTPRRKLPVNSTVGNIRKNHLGRHNFNDCVSTLKLCIDNYSQRAFTTLMLELKGNVRVVELHVFRPWEENVERFRNTQDIDLLFQTIRSLPSLKILNLANFLVEEIHDIALSQWQNESLHTIRIHLCTGTISERLLTILAGLQALRDLTLEMNESFPFHILLSSRTLESLSIVANDFHVDNLHAMEMVTRLHRNRILKNLTIEPPLQLRAIKFLAAALRKNIGIERLKFSILPGNPADNNGVICELAHTLMCNTFLKSIVNINYSALNVKERTCDRVMEALSKNFTIKELLLFNEVPLFHNKKEKILEENKGEDILVIPAVFNCSGDDGGCHGNECDYARMESKIGDSFSKISEKMKGKTRR
jgi:hypothetical protein